MAERCYIITFMGQPMIIVKCNRVHSEKELIEWYSEKYAFNPKNLAVMKPAPLPLIEA